VTVGALPDMLTFTPDGKKLLVANEATPSVYGSQIGSTIPRVCAPAPNDPLGSVSIIDVANRPVVATPGYARGLYMPDGMATIEAGGKTYVLMANEGDFREDDGDRVTAGSFLGAVNPLDRLRISSTETST